MANCSSVQGNYYFDFSRTNTTRQQQLEWLKKFSNALYFGDDPNPKFAVAYYSSLYQVQGCSDEEILKRFEDDTFFSLFDGCGRNDYTANIEFFEQDYLKSLITEMKGIHILIYWSEYETGSMLVGAGEAEINYQNEFSDDFQVQQSAEYEPLDEESYGRYGFDCWEELFPSDEEE